MRSIVGSLLVAVVAFGMMNLPAFGAGGDPLGVVIQAQDALVSNAHAEIGATVYPGDALATERDGTIRLRVGTGQLYLAPSSAASLTQNLKVTRVSVTSGTVGFVAVTSADLELETPIAMVRPASGQRAQGQVTVTGPDQMIVSAYSGALVVERNGESRIVEAGKSYNVRFDPNGRPSAQAPAGVGGATDQNGSGNNTDNSGNGNNGNANGNNGNGNNNGNNGNGGNNGGGNGNSNTGQLVFDGLVIGGTAGVGAIVWHVVTESSN